MRAPLNTNHQTMRERKTWKTRKKDGEGGREQEEKKRNKRNQEKVENGYRGGGRKQRKRERESSNNGSTGQQLVHGCILIIPQAARASSNLVVSLSFSLVLPCPLPPFADERWCTTEMRRNKNRRDGPPLQPSEPCPSASASVRTNS